MPFEDTQSGAWQGAVLGAALPAASMLDYEMRLLPQHRRTIDALVADAMRKNRLFATDPSTAASGISRHMRLGDAVAFSHKPTSTLGEILRNPAKMDMADMAFTGTGSSFPHVETASGRGRTVDTGLDDKKSPVTRLFNAIRENLKRGRAPLDQVDIDKLLVDNKPGKIDNMRKAMRGASYDTWKYMEEQKPHAAVVTRAGEFSKAEKNAIRAALVSKQQMPYSKTRGTLSGLFRLMFPFGDKLSQLPTGRIGEALDARLGRLGTFCSDGVCSAMKPTHAKAPLGSLSMPTDFLKNDLVGINLNSSALKLADKGTKGNARLASAAKNLLHGTLAQSANLRRGAGVALTAALGGIGLLGGAAAGGIRGATSDDRAS